MKFEFLFFIEYRIITLSNFHNDLVTTFDNKSFTTAQAGREILRMCENRYERTREKSVMGLGTKTEPESGCLQPEINRECLLVSG